MAHGERRFGTFNPSELSLLSRVLSRAVRPGDDEDHREARAKALIRLYSSGVTEEAALVEVTLNRP